MRGKTILISGLSAVVVSSTVLAMPISRSIVSEEILMAATRLQLLGHAITSPAQPTQFWRAHSRILPL